ncbi:uncharacterized protein BJ212DRAFT_1296381 [Suillus subaureus]|uniref:Uncharacterized protein n=1 Tax=Suillus subaureus TaxID=48587 RepID=A0A9P7EK93_9AGAM|nr:uncharacterized protein BJ212DRAFT_1296381 [Suillus subaureus]KAG1823851.1 hypothetical protein BJ212DRAFT_1296381 [Suillus subaureus]
MQCKDVLKCGLMRMTDDAIQQATLTKQASREPSHLCVILTVWEIEEAERHAELLHLLQHNNMEIYKEANDEASLFEKLLSDWSSTEVQNDLKLNLASYHNDLTSLANTDQLLDKFENHAQDRNLIISQEEFARDLKTLMTVTVVKSKKGKGKAKRVSPSDSYYRSGYDVNLNDQSGMGINPSSSYDASFGVPVPSMQPDRHDNIIIPPDTNFAALNTNIGAAPNSNVPPYNPYFAAPNPYFATAPNQYFAAPGPNIIPLNPCIAYRNANFTPPNPNFIPLNPHPPAPSSTALNIIAPCPQLAINTAALELVMESCRKLLFWRQWATEGHASVRSQPYDLMACQRSLCNDHSQAWQGEFEGEVSMPEGMPGVPGLDMRVLLPHLTAGCSMSGSTGGPSVAVLLTVESEINDQACDKIKSLLLNDNFMLHRDVLVLAMNNAIVKAMMKNISNQGRHLLVLHCKQMDFEEQWKGKKEPQDDLAVAPFGHVSVAQMVQAIIRQFCCHLPDNNDNINVDNIVAFVVTMLWFALREFSNGTYILSEFVAEGERAMYNEVLNRIKELNETNLEFYLLTIKHIFKLL